MMENSKIFLKVLGGVYSSDQRNNCLEEAVDSTDVGPE